jgi:hypothetical protein
MAHKNRSYVFFILELIMCKQCIEIITDFVQQNPTEKLTDTQTVKKPSAFYGTQMFINFTLFKTNSCTSFKHTFTSTF